MNKGTTCARDIRCAIWGTGVTCSSTSHSLPKGRFVKHKMASIWCIKKLTAL